MSILSGNEKGSAEQPFHRPQLLFIESDILQEP